jgi:cytochrome c-type biogenesis protein
MVDQNINLLISFAAGLLSFLTPCVLPLVPAYLSLIGGLTFQDIRHGRYKKTGLVARALVFIAGFTVVFVLMGIFLWGAFHLAGPLTEALNIVAGAVVILLGLNVLFDFASFLKREKRFSPVSKPATLVGVFAAGLALAAGWSPCIGPLLGGIIALSASGSTLWGAANLLVYSLGLGLPFIVLALAFLPVSAYLEKIKRHFNALRIASGVLLILIGVLILFGQFTGINAALYQTGSALERAYRANPWPLRIAFSVFYLVLGVLPIGWWLIRRRKLEPGAPPYVPIVRLVWLTLFATLAALETIGIIQSALLLSAWFSAGEISPL